MSVEAVFGELRSLLSQAPSALLWEQICALCDVEVARDSGRFEAEVLPYVSDGLLGWPDRMRAAPKGWIDAIVKEGTHPCGPLVRWIDLDWRPAHDRARLSTAQERAQLLTVQERARLVAAPCLAQVAELSLCAVGVQRLEQLEGASMLKSVRVLELGGASLEGAEAVFAQMPALTALHTGNNRRRDSLLLLDALEASGRLPAMESLSMGDMGFVAGDMARLGVCERLRTLAVWATAGLGDAGVAAICEALQQAPLTHLNVGGCGLTGESVARIAQAPWRLEQLLIWDNALDEDAASMLGRHEAFGALRMLQLSKTELSGAALAPLLSRRGPQPLRELWCEGLSELSAASWSAAAQGDTARGLEVLVAENAGLHGQGALEGLVAGMDGGWIKRLVLSNNGLEASHMLALRDARLQNLRELDLYFNPITDAGLGGLLAAGWIEGLEVLRVSGCGLSVAAVELLRAHAPRLGALRELHIQLDGVGDKAMREAICGALPDLKLRVRSWA